jgi:hypothetical protein
LTFPARWSSFCTYPESRPEFGGHHTYFGIEMYMVSPDSSGMAMSAANNPATRPAEEPQDSALATQDAALGTEHSDHPVALTGRVWCWCDASYGAITPGDLLTTSATAGHAMRADEKRDIRRGCVIGKAMSKLEKDKGLVLVLVQPQ